MPKYVPGIGPFEPELPLLSERLSMRHRKELSLINNETLKVFLQQLSVPELVILRHDAIKHGDKEAQKNIDEEIKRRTNA